MLRILATFLLVTFLEACSPVALLNGLAPRDGITVDRDITYAPAIMQHLDVYAPAKLAPGRPVVVFFYGGNWEEGDRAMYRFVGAALADQGFVTIIPDYRKYPEVRFPAFMKDAAMAVAWARSHAAQYGGDPDNLFLMGHSAGGQIATLLALNPAYLRADHADPNDIAGAIGLAGPYDFLPLQSETLKVIFGPEPDRPLSQPINYVTSAAPPMLLVAGACDGVVDPGNVARLASRLRAAGVPVEEHIYPLIGHAALAGALASPLRFLAPVRRDIRTFILEYATRSNRSAGAAE